MKDVHVVGKKLPKMVKKWPFMSHAFLRFFLPKLKKNVFYVVAFVLIVI